MGTKTRSQTTATERTTEWQSVIVADGSTVTTMVSGRGYFVNTSSAQGILKFPATAKQGDFVEIKDYARTFGTNKCVVQRNSHLVDGNAYDSDLDENGEYVKFIYMDDGTRGWTALQGESVGAYGTAPYIVASGGTETTSGNFKIHTFTGDGNFIVSNLSGTPSLNDVAYLVVAGGGAGGAKYAGGGGGAGGYREGKTEPVVPYTASPLAAASGITVTATTYPITVGAGGAGIPGPCGSNRGGSGSNSIFSTITSTGGGGGGGGGNSNRPINPGATGGSGGGGMGNCGTAAGTGGAGNTPSVSPPQGNEGGNGDTSGPAYGGGGGGGASEGRPGNNGSNTAYGRGGAGTPSQITGSAVAYAGGGGNGTLAPYPAPDGGGAGSPCGTGGKGGGGGSPASAGTNQPGVAGTANRGGGGGGSSPEPAGTSVSGAGGKGVVILRYRYQ